MVNVSFINKIKQRVRMYILCHNEERFAEAKTVYAPYYWAVPICMKYQDCTFENAFWKQLLEIKEEWVGCNMVGTLSSAAHRKIDPQTVHNVIHNTKLWTSGYYNFNDSDELIGNAHPNLSAIVTHVAAKLGFSLPTTSTCNYWMCRPDLMEKFIDWFEKSLKPAVLDHPLTMSDARYGGTLTKPELIKLCGTPYYPHVPFVIERLNKAFFTQKLYKSSHKTSHYYLLYYKEDISRFKHPHITPVRLSDDNPQFFESRGFLQIDTGTIPDVDYVGFITPSFFKKSGIKSLDNIFNLEVEQNAVCGYYLTDKTNTCINKSAGYHGDSFIKLWNHILTESGYEHFVGKDFICSYSNLWVAERQFTVEFILFIRKVIHILCSLTDDWKLLLNSDSKYNGSLLEGGRINDVIGFPYYTFHPFICERMIGLFAALKEYKYIDYNEYTSCNDQYVPVELPLPASPAVPRVLCIMACHTNSAVKVNAVINNIPFLKEICDTLILIDSDECIANKPYITARFPDVNIYHIPNDVLACFSKYIYIMKNLDMQQYDKIILCNDSFVIIKPLNRFRDKMLQDVDVTSLLASNEKKYHYTDFLRCYNNKSIGVIYNYYLDNAARITTFDDLINIYEIESTRLFTKRNVVFEAEEQYLGNINFDDVKLCQYISDGYPIIKCKRITMRTKYVSNRLPKDFKTGTYKLLNPDVKHFTEKQVVFHFQKHGWIEGRLYKPDQQINLPEHIVHAFEDVHFNPTRLL
jgi:hypothetical protein